jgi:lipocalin
VPSWFEPQSARLVTADYAVMPDGYVQVTNSYTDKRGHRHSAGARARPDPAGRPGVLRVSFFPPFESDYVVIHHGCEQPAGYDCAVVASKNNLWFLTRNPRPTTKQMMTMRNAAIRAGLPVNRLQVTPR